MRKWHRALRQKDLPLWCRESPVVLVLVLQEPAPLGWHLHDWTEGLMGLCSDLPSSVGNSPRETIGPQKPHI